MLISVTNVLLSNTQNLNIKRYLSSIYPASETGRIPRCYPLPQTMCSVQKPAVMKQNSRIPRNRLLASAGCAAHVLPQHP